ncbi:MAG: phosphoglucosamine mutase [Clostridiales bacterium]|jgi:phosphoglucosamine mutase|nr:phosphoglucosamine mutase [Clostridiales bacterium]
MGRLFGTDGIRGVANTELTPELAFKVGQAGAYVLTEETHHKAKILVGKDTRISGDMLEAALIAGICSVGAEAISIGVIPTPAVAYLTRLYNADAGVVISASHNPVEYNGIKYFNNKGYKLSDEIEERIEAIILDNAEQIPVPTGKDIGHKTENEDALDDYIKFVKSTIDVDLKGLKIALDCANGAAYEAAPIALFELGAEVSVIHNEPDGTNINLNCGSTHMEQLQKFVVASGADIGLAFDGDADRVLAVDEQGNLVDGDQIMAICALNLMEQGKLKDNTLVATVMSNLGLFLMAKEKGLKIKQTKVGDRYVLEEMRENAYIIGGEQSGHIIFLEHNTTGDGMITALQLLSILKKSGKKVSELASVMQRLPQVLVNAKVKNGNKNTYMEDEVIAQAVKELENTFKDSGRVLIRPSGTEPLVRVMIEGQNKEFLQQKAEELANLIEERLG